MSNLEMRLEQEINKLGVTHVAKLLGVARNTIYNWISKGNIPLNMLLLLHEAGVDVLYIMTGNRSEAAPGERSRPARGLEDYPEVGAEEILNAVDQLADLMVATGTVIPPKKLSASVRMAAQLLADDARKRSTGVPVAELGRLRELVILLG
ncbi:MAG: helix-turn-helix domain-containing protein [Magnetococcales bacterium]|nr:helix-turn-helix domain-containing protein [Magnetococcales bacterium]